MQTDHTITLPDGRRLTAALALPTGVAPDGGWPGVLVVHEVPSLTPSIRDVADVFATRGWAAVVPDLFSAENRLGCLVRSIREIRAGRAGAVTADLQQALTWLQNREDVDRRGALRKHRLLYGRGVRTAAGQPWARTGCGR